LSVTDESLSAISIDGKTLCATLRVFSKAVHLLAAVDHRTGCVLSQSRVDEKTNEHKGALELLKTIVLQGRFVVGDAAFCQRDVCQQILQAGGDYFLAVKENQPGLRWKIEHEFAAQDAAFPPPYQQQQKDHSRPSRSITRQIPGRRMASRSRITVDKKSPLSPAIESIARQKSCDPAARQRLSFGGNRGPSRRRTRLSQFSDPPKKSSIAILSS